MATMPLRKATRVCISVFMCLTQVLSQEGECFLLCSSVSIERHRFLILLPGEISRGGRKEHLRPKRAATSLVEFGGSDWVHRASNVFPLALGSLWKESVAARCLISLSCQSSILPGSGEVAHVLVSLLANRSPSDLSLPRLGCSGEHWAVEAVKPHDLEVWGRGTGAREEVLLGTSLPSHLIVLIFHP